MLDETGQWLDLRASFGAGAILSGKPGSAWTKVSWASSSAAKSRCNWRTSKPPPFIKTSMARQRRAGFAVERAAGLRRADHRHPQRLYRRAAQLFQRGSPHPHRLAELSAIAIEKARLYERVVDVEEQLRQNEKLSALGLLAAEVAHEIRNPLTVMKMLYHSLAWNSQPGDPRVKDDAILREKMEHLNKIVEQILDFARSAEPKLSEVNLNQLLNDLACSSGTNCATSRFNLSAAWRRNCRKSWPTARNWRRPF
jgi:signal transduction histidine kinase